MIFSILYWLGGIFGISSGGVNGKFMLLETVSWCIAAVTIKFLFFGF